MNIGTGVMTSVADVLSTVFELMGVQRRGGDGPVADRQGGRSGTGDRSLSGSADTKLARALFAWEAEHDLREGLRKTVAWYLEQERS